MNKEIAMTEEEQSLAIVQMIEQFDLKNAKFYGVDVEYTGFWKDIPFDIIKISYKQWWKFPKKVKIKRDYTHKSLSGGDITRIESKHADTAIYLLAALSVSNVPKSVF